MNRKLAVLVDWLEFEIATQTGLIKAYQTKPFEGSAATLIVGARARINAFELTLEKVKRIEKELSEETHEP